MIPFLLLASFSLAAPSSGSVPAERAAAKKTLVKAKRPAPIETRGKADSTLPARPVKISSQRFEVLQNSQKATWTGNVLIERDDLKVACDALVADYDEQQHLKLLTCKGNAHMHQAADPPKHEEREAWGELATFESATEVLTVTGTPVERPRAREGTTRMRGDKVSYFARENKLLAQGNVELEAESEKAEAKRP
jgi:lipopolysaccharide transport protein LptA